MKNLLIAGFIAMLLLCTAVMAEEISNSTDNESEQLVISNLTESNLTEELNQTVDDETVSEINDELNESAGAVDMFKERIKLWLTFNQEKKAEIEFKLAKLELIRAKIAAKNNDSKAMEKALEAHNRLIEKIQARINAIDGKDTEKGIKNTATKLVGLERAIEVHEARIAKLNELLMSENLTEEQIGNIQAKLEKAENNTAHLKDVEAAKIEKLKLLLMAKADMTEEQADAAIEEIQNAQNLSAVKKLVKEIKASRNENAVKVISRVIAKLEERQNETAKNTSKAIEKLTLVRQKLQERAGKVNSAENQAEQENNETDTEEPENETLVEIETDNECIEDSDCGENGECEDSLCKILVPENETEADDEDIGTEECLEDSDCDDDEACTANLCTAAE